MAARRCSARVFVVVLNRRPGKRNADGTFYMSAGALSAAVDALRLSTLRRCVSGPRGGCAALIHPTMLCIGPPRWMRCAYPPYDVVYRVAAVDTLRLSTLRRCVSGRRGGCAALIYPYDVVYRVAVVDALRLSTLRRCVSGRHGGCAALIHPTTLCIGPPWWMHPPRNVHRAVGRVSAAHPPETRKVTPSPVPDRPSRVLRNALRNGFHLPYRARHAGGSAVFSAGLPPTGHPDVRR